MSSSNIKSKEERRLSVIFAADVAGYSRLMASNESRTLALLEASRRFIDKKIHEYNGKIANTAGDSVIATFNSATEAYNCSIVIQEYLVEQNQRYSESKRLLFRIGLHMGEIFKKGTDVLGSGVNIAARLEGSTQPGAICMSEYFYSIVDRSAMMARPIADLGDLELKNIDVPVRAYEVLSDRAKRTGIEARHQVSVAKQKKVLIAVAGGISVVLLTIAFAVAVASNLWKVAEMAKENKIIEPVHKVQPEEGEKPPILPPPVN